MKQNNFSAKWLSLKNKYGHKRVVMMAYLLIVGVFAIIIHGLFYSGYGHSAVLYMLIPYCISWLITVIRPYGVTKSKWGIFLRHMTTVTVIFLATSIVLAEGFVCVVFFYPIYFIVAALVFAVSGTDKSKTMLRSVALPIFILLLSLEGTSESLTIERDLSVRVSKITHLSVSEIKANMARPFDLDKNRHWLLSIFPMPYEIEAGSLNVGDIHKIKTRYHRWFVTNTHEGEAQLLIEHVGENLVRTKLLNDSTYFSSYLSMHGTQIEFKTLAKGETEITLQIDFKRKLDPAWYFQPIQKLGVSKMADFLIDEIMIREDSTVLR